MWSMRKRGDVSIWNTSERFCCACLNKAHGRQRQWRSRHSCPTGSQQAPQTSVAAPMLTLICHVLKRTYITCLSDIDTVFTNLYNHPPRPTHMHSGAHRTHSTTRLARLPAPTTPPTSEPKRGVAQSPVPLNLIQAPTSPVATRKRPCHGGGGSARIFNSAISHLPSFEPNPSKSRSYSSKR